MRSVFGIGTEEVIRVGGPHYIEWMDARTTHPAYRDPTSPHARNSLDRSGHQIRHIICMRALIGKPYPAHR